MQKRMLEASYQVERVKAQAEARGHERPLTRVLSEPAVLQLAAAREAAARAENGSFKRRRAHSTSVNKHMASILRNHACFTGDSAPAAAPARSNGRHTDPEAGTKDPPLPVSR